MCLQSTIHFLVSLPRCTWHYSILPLCTWHQYKNVQCSYLLWYYIVHNVVGFVVWSISVWCTWLQLILLILHIHTTMNDNYNSWHDSTHILELIEKTASNRTTWHILTNNSPTILAYLVIYFSGCHVWVCVYVWLIVVRKENFYHRLAVKATNITIVIYLIDPRKIKCEFDLCSSSIHMPFKVDLALVLHRSIQ